MAPTEDPVATVDLQLIKTYFKLLQALKIGTAMDTALWASL